MFFCVYPSPDCVVYARFPQLVLNALWGESRRYQVINLKPLNSEHRTRKSGLSSSCKGELHVGRGALGQPAQRLRDLDLCVPSVTVTVDDINPALP